MSGCRLTDSLELSSRDVELHDKTRDLGKRRRIAGAKRDRWGGYIDEDSLFSERYEEQGFLFLPRGIEEEEATGSKQMPVSPTPARKRPLQEASDSILKADSKPGEPTHAKIPADLMTTGLGGIPNRPAADRFPSFGADPIMSANHGLSEEIPGSPRPHPETYPTLIPVENLAQLHLRESKSKVVQSSDVHPASSSLSPGDSAGMLPGSGAQAPSTPQDRLQGRHPGERHKTFVTPFDSKSASWARSAITSADDRTKHVIDKLKHRFDRRFQVLTVPALSALPSILDRGVDFCKSEAGVKIRAEMAAILNKGGEHEAEYTKVLCAYFNSIARSMVDSYRDLFFETGSGFMSTGAVPLRTGAAVDKNKPDMLVTCEPFLATKGNPRPSWNQVAAVFEVKCSGQKDMDKQLLVGQLMRFAVSIPAFLKYTSCTDANGRMQSSVVEHNPMSKNAIAFSVAGQRMRMFCCDAFSYSTSLPCDLDQPKHFLDLVEMIAFCVGPIGCVRPVWEPSLQTLPCSCLERIDWTNVKISKLCARNELCGRRTAVWHLLDRPANSLVVKASWLTPELSRHEGSILQHLRAPDKHDKKAVRDACDIDQFLIAHPEYRETYDRLPRYVGCHCGQDGRPAERTKSVPKLNSDDQEFLELAVLVTDGPVGKVIPAQNQELGLREILQVFLDVFKTYRVAARCAVCYRDVNLGNIVWEKTETGIRGWLIDWGNAIIGGDHRKDGADVNDIVAACQDDAHLANIYFLCRAGFVNRPVADDYTSKLLAATGLGDPKAPGLSTEDRRKRERAWRQVKLAEEKLRALLRQRYIDDLESCIYVLVFVVSYGLSIATARLLMDMRRQILGNVKSTAAAEFLCSQPEKCKAWQDGFKAVSILQAAGITSGTEPGFLTGTQIFRDVNVHQAFKDLLFNLTETVRVVQEDLLEMHAKVPIGVGVTQEEDECTAECVQLIEQSLAFMPTKGFR